MPGSARSRSMSPGLGGLAESLCRFSLFLRLLRLAEVQAEASPLTQEWNVSNGPREPHYRLVGSVNSSGSWSVVGETGLGM